RDGEQAERRRIPPEHAIPGAEPRHLARGARPERVGVLPPLVYPALHDRCDETHRGDGSGSGGRCRSFRSSAFTPSTILAYARVDASSPVHGTVSGVSPSVWKYMLKSPASTPGANRKNRPRSPGGGACSGSAYVETPNSRHARIARSCSFGRVGAPAYHSG